jgi:hypothetical protein
LERFKDRTLVLFPTYACNAACRDCGTYSSPADRHVAEPHWLHKAIDEAVGLGFKLVVLSGGEATLRWASCLELIRHATDVGLPTRLVTNGHWATDPEKAKLAATELCEAGLKEVNLSTGDEHVRFVPLETMVTAINALVSSGLDTLVMLELRGENKVTKIGLIDALEDAVTSKIRFVESPWMPMKKGPGSKVRYRPGLDASNVHASTGCDSVLSSFVVAADGRIGACCGLGMRAIPELQVGVAGGASSLDSAITRAEADFLKVWISTWGTHRIVAWAAQFDPKIKWEGLYAHRCHACAAIYRDPAIRDVITAHGHEVMAEVAMEILSESVISDVLSPALSGRTMVL